MESVAEGTKVKVREWADRHKHAVLYDEPESTFLDVASGKRIKIAWRDLTAWEEKIDRETQEAVRTVQRSTQGVEDQAPISVLSTFASSLF